MLEPQMAEGALVQGLCVQAARDSQAVIVNCR